MFGGSDHVGAIDEADSGTLYMAAIDELPLLIQPRFLRFLMRTNGCAWCSLALRERVERGKFRRDLGERLTLVQLVLPDAWFSV
ncbi:MAG TPA: sigma 54-interacting transcriptional regulator [Polyangiaceae bacterium]|nr:sigma 54-interacting transcriptional regulator [Polyangiaceae bacterium]